MPRPAAHCSQTSPPRPRAAPTALPPSCPVWAPLVPPYGPPGGKKTSEVPCGLSPPAPRPHALAEASSRLTPPARPQVLSTRILAMKASLCKLSPCTVTRVCDYHAKLFLIAVSSTLKSLLRPHFLNTPDKSPGDRLTEICAKITDVGGSGPSAPCLPRQFPIHHTWLGPLCAPCAFVAVQPTSVQGVSAGCRLCAGYGVVPWKRGCAELGDNLGMVRWGRGCRHPFLQGLPFAYRRHRGAPSGHSVQQALAEGWSLGQPVCARAS